MKNCRKTWLYASMVIGVSLIFTSCKKEDREESSPKIIYNESTNEVGFTALPGAGAIAMLMGVKIWVNTVAHIKNQIG